MSFNLSLENNFKVEPKFLSPIESILKVILLQGRERGGRVEGGRGKGERVEGGI